MKLNHLGGILYFKDKHPLKTLLNEPADYLKSNIFE
jgi:hypothetical protein